VAWRGCALYPVATSSAGAIWEHNSEGWLRSKTKAWFTAEKVDLDNRTEVTATRYYGSSWTSRTLMGRVTGQPVREHNNNPA